MRRTPLASPAVLAGMARARPEPFSTRTVAYLFPVEVTGMGSVVLEEKFSSGRDRGVLGSGR